MPENGELGIGVGIWEVAGPSFLTCPRCGARCKVAHRENMHRFGGLAHEHGCTRCRHVWQQEPEAPGICLDVNCESHAPGKDRTTAGYSEMRKGNQ